MNMTPNPNGRESALSIAYARRFGNKTNRSNSKIDRLAIYAQDADGIKYTFPNAVKAATELIKLKFVSFRSAEKENDPQTVKIIARELLRACGGASRKPQHKHRMYGFDWYYRS